MKRLTDTSRAAYQALEATLTDRQTFVRQLLREFREAYGTWPTSLELLRFAVARHPERCRHFDVNSIRPRLFELEAQGFVAKGPKRACSVTRKTVYVWVVTSPVPPAVHDPVLARARQVELL